MRNMGRWIDAGIAVGRSWHFLVCLASAAVAGAACGGKSSANEPPPAPQPDGGADAVALPDVAADTDAPADSDSPLDTGQPDAIDLPPGCEGFAVAHCERMATCAPLLLEGGYGSLEQCLERHALDCRKLLEALGDGGPLRQSLDTCSRAQAETTCDAYPLHRVPDACRPPGPRGAGQPCGYDAQCESSICSREFGNACGVCRAAPARGEPCVDSRCGLGLVCTQAGNCERPKLTLGADCSGAADCIELFCVQGTCVRAGELGARCGSSDEPPCNESLGLFCNLQSKTCENVIYAGPNEACGEFDNRRISCRAGWCRKEGGDLDQTGTCEALTEDGEACVSGGTCRPPAECVDGICRIREFSSCQSIP
jgi:hypothetical protein